MLLSSTKYQKYAYVFRIAPVPNSPTPPYTVYIHYIICTDRARRVGLTLLDGVGVRNGEVVDDSAEEVEQSGGDGQVRPDRMMHD